MTALPTLLSYITWDINPDIFTIPFTNHPLRWYGVLFAVGFLLSQQVMYYIYTKEGRPKGEVDTLTIYMIVATIIGARLGHVLFYSPLYYLQHPWKIVMTWEGGLASHGGAIGILIAIWLFARKTKVPYLWLVDRIVIVVSLTGCMIRLGNLMNSEMIGLPTTMPWGFIFTSYDNIPRHPAQLYEAIYCFFLFILLFWIWYKRKDQMQNGFIFGWFLIILFGLRFVDEFFKIDQEAFEAGMLLNMGQILSIPFVLAGVVILVRNRMMKTAIRAGKI